MSCPSEMRNVTVTVEFSIYSACCEHICTCSQKLFARCLCTTQSVSHPARLQKPALCRVHARTRHIQCVQ